MCGTRQLLMWVVAAGIGMQTQCTSEPVASSQPAKGRGISASLRAPGTTAASRPALQGGAEMIVDIAAERDALVNWEFGSAGTVLAKGAVKMDGSGAGVFKADLPQVRHRATLTLRLYGAQAAAQVQVDVLPTMLDCAKETLAGLRVGVMDPSGRTQAAMKCEGVMFDDLKSQMTQDCFDGGMVVLSGFDNAAMLDDADRRLDGRIWAGAWALVLNPPAGWQGWGLERVELDGADRYDARIAPELGHVLKESDLSGGPARPALRTGQDDRVLAWLERSPQTRPKTGAAVDGASTDRGMQPGEVPVLIAAHPCGRGWVVVASLPELRDLSGSVVGRCALSEIILWALEQGAKSKESEPWNP